MTNERNQHNISAPNALGIAVGLIAGDLGAAVATCGALWTGFCCVNIADHVSVDDKWKLYLIAAGIFVAVLVACRWSRSRS